MTDDLFKTTNPLLELTEGEDDSLAVDIDQVTAPGIIRRKETPQAKHKRLLRGENARQAIRDMQPDEEIFGFTKGQFSLIDLLTAVLEQTGPADLTVATWTAATSDVGEVARFFKSGLIRSARFIVDVSSQRRKPAFVGAIREAFGDDALRVTQIHAKFCTIRNDEWDIVVRTSMNLNQNPRFEDFTINNDERLADFLGAVVDDLFKKRSRGFDWTPNRQNFADL